MSKISRFVYGWTVVVAGLLLFVSCREVTEPVAPAEDEIDYTIFAGAARTRTTNDGVHTCWAAGDALSVLHCASGGNSFYSSGFDYVGENTFRGRVRGLSASNDWYLVYPYRSDNVSPEAIHVTVPASQTQSGNGTTAHLAGESFPLFVSAKNVAQDTPLSVTMDNALAVFKYTVTNTTSAPIVVKSVELTAPVAVAGAFEVDLTTEPVRWTPASETGSAVALTVTDGASIAANGQATFCLATIPFTAAAGSTIQLKVTAVHPDDPTTEIPFYDLRHQAEDRTFAANMIVDVPLAYDEGHQAVDAKRTYRLQSELSEGTYLILGNETQTNPALYLCTFPANSDKVCPQVLYSEDRTVSTIVTEDADIIAQEVVLKQSGSGWLIKAKVNGQYLYYADGGVAFTSDATQAVHSANSSGSDIYIGSYHFYHSGSGGHFKYKSSAGNNLAFFKLGANDPVIPDGASYSLENEQVALYLTRMENHPYDIEDRSESVVADYCSGVSSNNRLDWPKPVPVHWDNPAEGNTSKTINIYTDSDCTELATSVSASANNVSADVYNLIPGMTYYYQVLNGSTLLKSGYFFTKGRRRMMKIGTGYGANYANNCRDLGGQVAQDGRTIRYGRIYRGTNMDQLTSDCKNYIKNELHVGLDVDLRGYSSSPGSGGNYLNDALNLGNITMYNADVYLGHTQERYPSDNINVEVSALTNPNNMRATLTRIMNAVLAGTNVYVHCRIGADRTGFTCMMIEALLGIPLERCEVDYELTSFSSSGLRTRGGSQDGVYFQCSEIVKARPGATFQAKAVDYAVNVLGVDSALITAFQNAMLENPSNN